jgi:citrate lyase subunit beta/citryl-CoA lyase
VSPITYLFVPGNRPDRFDKAVAGGADRIIVDLEDAVAPVDKAFARQAIANWFQNLSDDVRARIVVRINDATTHWFIGDLQWLRTHAVNEVMLSKCESSAQIARVHEHMQSDGCVLPLIETVRGVLALSDIAKSPHVSRLAFGAIDYAHDLDVPEAGFAADVAALSIAMASRAAELAPPVAGVTPGLDAQCVKSNTAHARSLGFGAKLCIHPSQVMAVREALMPSTQEQAWAERVITAWQASNGSGAIQVDGKMVDKPVVLRAQRILHAAGVKS